MLYICTMITTRFIAAFASLRMPPLAGGMCMERVISSNKVEMPQDTPCAPRIIGERR